MGDGPSKEQPQERGVYRRNTMRSRVRMMGGGSNLDAVQVCSQEEDALGQHAPMGRQVSNDSTASRNSSSSVSGVLGRKMRARLNLMGGGFQGDTIQGFNEEDISQPDDPMGRQLSNESTASRNSSISVGRKMRSRVKSMGGGSY
mmetsp:Transcript_54015/g.84058  ORF Transcript_54015/g.84058 Transcript_54015/m.84058 type:complete len:145 (-) Transcript_54015:200-634(-)